MGGYSQAADVWSAGVILYILLSGVPPFWGKTKSKIFEAVRAANLRFPASHWEGISSLAKDLIAGMLQLDPTKRLSAAEVIGTMAIYMFSYSRACLLRYLFVFVFL